jgi:outer membrane receptor protein involved in Fe transport
MLSVITMMLALSEPLMADGIVVSGERHAAKEAETARSIERAERKALDDAGHLDLAEFFATLPGVSLREGAPGAISPLIRGLMGADNLILIDGLRYNTSLLRRGASGAANSLGLYSFEGLELIRGSGGVGYGSGALGGVLSMRTRDLEKPDKRWWYWREFFAYPGYYRYNFTSLLKKQSGPFAIALAVQRDKFRSRRHGDLLAGLDAAEIPKADHGQTDWLLKMRYRTQAWLLHFGYLGLRVGGGGQIDQLPRGELRRSSPSDHFAWLRAKGRHSGAFRRSEFFIGSRSAARDERVERCDVAASGNVLDRQACLDRMDLEPGDEGFSESGLLQRLVETEKVLMHQAGFRLLSKRFKGWRLRTGGEAAVESVSGSQSTVLGTGLERSLYGDGLGYLTGGLFAQLQGDLAKLGTKQLSLSAGLRLAVFGVLDSQDDRSQTWLRPAAELALNLRRRGRSSSWLSMSSSSRAPNLFEMFYEGDTGAFYQESNDQLRPQTAYMFEFGSKRRSGALTYQGSLFGLFISDLLEEQLGAVIAGNNKPVIRLANVDQGRFFGGDLGIQHKINDTLSQGHQLGVVIGEIEDQGRVHVSRRSAPLQGRHTLRQKWTKTWWGEASIDWASGVGDAGLAPLDAYDLNVCPAAEQPWLSSAQAGSDCSGSSAWWTAGLRAVWQRKKDYRLGFRIDNLLDRKYRTHQSASWAKGLTVRLDVEVAF